jgi:hypothetical protein
MSMEPPVSYKNEITLMAVTRLRRALGPGLAERCAENALAKLGLSELQSPADLLQFANYLLQQNGAAYMVGSALKVTALLRGAREVAP